MTEPLRFGYGTNGFANHRLTDALAVIADLGYARGRAHPRPRPPRPVRARPGPRGSPRSPTSCATSASAVVIETGARYLLDPWRKHAPTLLHDDRKLRLDFLRRAVAVGADLGAEAVSFWAGVGPPTSTRATAWHRLVDGCAEIAELAAARRGAARLRARAGHAGRGHRRLAPAARRRWARRPGSASPSTSGTAAAWRPQPVPDCVTAVAEHLVNVQIDDMRRGVHEHLEFGTGEIDFPPVLRALPTAATAGLVAVELPRHSHAAPTVAARVAGVPAGRRARRSSR